MRRACGRAGGNLRLVEALAEGLPVMYNSVVTDVAYSRAGVRVQTAGGAFTGARPALRSGSRASAWLRASASAASQAVTGRPRPGRQIMP